MRTGTLIVILAVTLTSRAADLESRVLTHYVPQDFLEKVVRTEGWTELPLDVKGGVRKGDVVRIWAGGSIDRGGDQPGENVNSPAGTSTILSTEAQKLALTAQAEDAFALEVLNSIAAEQPDGVQRTTAYHVDWARRIRKAFHEHQPAAVVGVIGEGEVVQERMPLPDHRDLLVGS